MLSHAHRSLLALPLVAVLMLAAGCGESSKSTAPALDQTNADDVAVQTTFALDQLGQDIGGMVATISGPTLLHARPAWALWDTTVTEGGLTYTISENFYDAQNQLLTGYGPDAVKLVWTSAVTGAIETLRDTATVAHHAVLQLTGIQPADTAVTFQGTALDTLRNTFRSYDGTRTRYFLWKSGLTGTNIVWGKGHPWPWSGTLTYVVRADRMRSNEGVDVEAHLSATVVVTFNGTSQPDVVVDGTWHYKWNMDTGEVVRA